MLAAWSGLGYNRRARYLQAAAVHVHNHGWPATARGLQDLPGVGPYTAAAIASFAYGEAVAAVDTNAKRVLSRWNGTALGGRELAAAADQALDRSRPADWNQAMMDLGARVCTPRPDCDPCPVSSWCVVPSVYAPPPRQNRFVGSRRQARGSVLRALVAVESATRTTLAHQTGLELDRLLDALSALESEGMVERSGRRWQVPAGSTPESS